MESSHTAPAVPGLHPVVQQAVEFTRVYRAHESSHPALREAACLRAQFPHFLSPLREGEVFAGGNRRERIAYTGSMWWTTMRRGSGPGKQGGYCFDFGAVEKYGQTKADQEVLEELTQFWEQECTWSKVRRTWDEDMVRVVRQEGQINGGGCGFVFGLDLDRLLQAGLPGMQELVRQRLSTAEKEGDEEAVCLSQGMGQALEVVIGCCQHYKQQAEDQLREELPASERVRLQRIASSLQAITVRAPETLHEAIQLWWIYSVMTSGLHIEGWRLDVALGDFLARDLDSGHLSEEDAIEMVCGLWRMFAQHSDPAVSRVMVGGLGRRNAAAADRFCRVAMEATRRVRQVIPQLTLRFHEDQSPALLTQAFDVLSEGCIFPMLYNDDAIIPGVMRALRVDSRGAESYYPLGCGEYMVGGASPSLLNVGWSVPRSLEAALYGGRNAEGSPIGLSGPSSHPDFGSVWDALLRQIGYAADVAARCYTHSNAVLGRECSFLLGSLLTADCLARGRGVLGGGARHIGGCVMGHGFTNTADALVAIKQVVFRDRFASLEEVCQALRADFVGFEALRFRLQAAPKYGNDETEADEMLVALWREMSRLTGEAGDRVGLDFLTVSSVNPGGYSLGASCGATADGRLAGEPFAIGNAPTAGADRRGITAMLNSVSKVDPANGGSVTSVKLARELFAVNRPKLEALFRAYWKRGGTQASLTVLNQADLEDAVEHPERYPHLLVRVGGWTSRFIDLDRLVQQEVIRRTLY